MPITFNGTTKKIPLSKVDLKEFLEFYKNEICQYLYTYELENKMEIIIKFEVNNFSHLLGLHKFKTIKDYKNSNNINRDILNNKITFKELYSNEANVLKTNEELGDRMTYFPVLRTLLENADIALQYDINAMWNTKIRFSFLLRTSKITVLVYLAVKKIEGNKQICVPVSFLVDRNDRFSKMSLKELKVNKITITEK